MNEKKRAALTVAAVNDGNGQILLRGFKPKKDIITDFEPAQGTIAPWPFCVQILELLP